MRWYTKLVIAALTTTALLASLTASASARNFSLSNRNIRAVWAAIDPLEFVSEIATVRCPVTLEGTFHCGTISKVAEALIGYITRAMTDQENCRDSSGNGIRARVREETLPWHIRYVSFSGTLPRVRVRLRIVAAGFRLLNVPIVGNCLYRATVDRIVVGPEGNEIGEGNGTAALRPEEGREIASETFGCPRIRFRSTGPAPLLLLGNNALIFVRLT